MYQKRNDELRVLGLYTCGYAKQLYLREISKFLLLPIKTTQETLKRLKGIKVLKSELRGKNKYFFLNPENAETKLYLLQAEIYKTNTFINKYPTFGLFLKNIKSNTPIIVFGSFAALTASKTSDIDLLVVGKTELPFHLLPNKAHTITIPERSFAAAIEREPLFKKIEENHVVLNNHSFFVNAVWNKYVK